MGDDFGRIYEIEKKILLFLERRKLELNLTILIFLILGRKKERKNGEKRSLGRKGYERAASERTKEEKVYSFRNLI